MAKEKGLHDLLKELLPATEDKAKHASQVAQELHISESRLKRYIRKERLAGSPILSSSRGYWWSNNPYELRAHINKTSRYGASLFETVRGLEAINIEGQMTIFDEDVKEE